MKTFSLLLGTILLAGSAFGQQAGKRRVAVLDFQYATVMSGVQAVFGTNQDIGRGIADLLIDRLTNDGTFRVIERRDLDKILKEQNFSNSDRADNTTAAKIGRILGVDTIIVGDITQFGRDDRNTGAGGALSRWDKYGIGNVGVHKAKAVVGITARMIDVNTGEILASVSGLGESKRSGASLLGSGGAFATSGGGNVDMSSTNFGQTIIGEAVNASVTQLAGRLEQNAGRLPQETVKVNGLVADATGNTITINVGTRAGVHVGDKLAITRVDRVIKDPATGKPLRTVEQPVGELQITSADEGSAVGTFTGSGQPKVGDTVKNLPN
ncbi:MAG TPA: CsgG/HfaB family protein [Bryobacteraceae bacterium]|nr:CsgG/HfaB family protein [Bryobacteraceae bacterium]